MKKTIIALGILSVCGALSNSVSAGPLLTAQQDVSFSFATLNDSTTLLFNGFDASLGTLESVHFQFTLSETLNNTAFVVPGSGAQAVGSPVPLTATATTTATGPAGLVSSNTLTTDPFVGSVPDNGLINIVGTKSLVNFLVGPTVVNGNPISLAAYIGGTNAVSISLSSSGTQGGSVPAVVLSGNTGSASGIASIFYDYSVSTAAVVPEIDAIAGTGALTLLAGAVALAGERRRRRA